MFVYDSVKINNYNRWKYNKKKIFIFFILGYIFQKFFIQIYICVYMLYFYCLGDFFVCWLVLVFFFMDLFRYYYKGVGFIYFGCQFGFWFAVCIQEMFVLNEGIGISLFVYRLQSFYGVIVFFDCRVLRGWGADGQNKLLWKILVFQIYATVNFYKWSFEVRGDVRF